MAVQVVRSDVCDRGHVRMEVHDRLELEAGNLSDCHGLISCLECVGSIRISDISYYEYALIKLLHDLSGERCRRCLSVCAGDRGKFSL